MKDVVFPRNNEEEFISMAFKLGYDELCFVYDSIEELNRKKKMIKNKQLKLCFGLDLKSRKKNSLVVDKASGNSREVIESKNADIIYGFEIITKKDYIHHRASGLNHVLCKLMSKNKVAIGFSVSLILNYKQKAVLMGRMKQNIKLCRKYKVKMVIGSFSSEPYEMRPVHDLISLFCLLGMHASEAKNALRITLV